ncbi:hypothetical protein QTO34_013022 [Cnephaeus nilssonii]|uniref:Uncharacterized protein n=1 Tax=Cnephaeus nilssonii TaxID=3371016 RepID=A0AA40HA68_CNENI|nr:hypothetical protein QTO34_013022 [Eptesicus nilssonii]
MGPSAAGAKCDLRTLVEVMVRGSVTRSLECLLVSSSPCLLSFLKLSQAMSRPSLITFTPATDPSDFWKDGQQQSQAEELEPTLDGAAARAFYEALIGDESSTPEPQRSQPEPASERKRKKRRMCERLQQKHQEDMVRGDPLRLRTR